MFNHAPVVHSLARELDCDWIRPEPRRRCISEPTLLPGYPSSGTDSLDNFIDVASKRLQAVLRREAEQSARLALEKHTKQAPGRGDSVEEPFQYSETTTTLSPPSPRSPEAFSFLKAKKRGSAPWKDPQPFEVFRAIERKDIIYLMEIRDRAFHLLLRKTGDATPLLHSMRIGDSHKEVSIILLGAFSRWVNHLEDDKIDLPQTRTLLKSLRMNLKLAIDYGLITSQSALIASFLQTLIMSEGDKWVRAQVHSVAMALKMKLAGKPVEHAQAAVRSFATKQLGKAEMIASLEDYIANATSDLLMMGAWELVLDYIKADCVPTYCFARDDRVHKFFCDQLDEHQVAIRQKAPKRLCWQLGVLQDIMEGRSSSYRQKVENLAGILDIDSQEPSL